MREVFFLIRSASNSCRPSYPGHVVIRNYHMHRSCNQRLQGVLGIAFEINLFHAHLFQSHRDEASARCHVVNNHYGQCVPERHSVSFSYHQALPVLGPAKCCAIDQFDSTQLTGGQSFGMAYKQQTAPVQKIDQP